MSGSSSASAATRAAGSRTSMSRVSAIVLFFGIHWTRSVTFSVSVLDVLATFDTIGCRQRIRFRNADPRFARDGVFASGNRDKRTALKRRRFGKRHLRQIGRLARERKIF